MGTHPHNEDYGYDNNSRGGSSRDSYPGDRGGGDRGNDRGGGGDKKKEFELYPEATYPVVAVGHRFGWTSNRNAQIGIRLRITDGPLKDKTLLYYGTFTDAAKEYTIKALRALGMYGDDVFKDISQIYNGVVANAVYAHETFEGVKRGKVNWINGADVVMKDEMDENDLKTFAQRLRGDMKRFPGGGKAPATSSSSTPPQSQQRSRDEAPRDDRRGGSGGGGGQQQSFQKGRGEPPPPSDDDAPWQRERR